MSADPLRFVFFGHHKAASSWLHRLFWNVFTDAGIPYHVYRFLDDAEREELSQLVAATRGPLAIGVSNARPGDLEQFEGFKGIHVVRDPRDMIVSAYYSHRDTHPLFPGLAEERELLKSASYAEGLHVVMDGIMRSTLEDMMRWPGNPGDRMVELKYEDLVADYGVVRDIFEGFQFVKPGAGPLAWPVRAWNQLASRSRLGTLSLRQSLPSRSSFNVHLDRLLKNRRQRQEAVAKGGQADHHRPDKKEKWADVFDEKHREHFDKNFPGLIQRYGYPEWRGDSKATGVPG